MKLIKNLSWIFFANVFASFAKWLIVILIAKNLTATEVGIYSLAFAIGAPITLFANMKLRSLFITSTEDNLNDYFFTRNILSVVVFVVLAIIGWFLYTQYFFIIILVGLAKVLDLQSDLYYAVPHKNNKLDIVGKMLLSKNAVLLISFAITIILTLNLSFALLVQVLIQIIFLVFVERKYVLNNYTISKHKPTFKGIKGILLLGIPLGFVQMVFSLNSNYPRYILEYFESPKVLGYFSAILYIATVANLFMSAISQVFLPKLSQLYKINKITLFKKYIFTYLTLTSVCLGVVLTGFSYLFGEQLLTILYGPDYAAYSSILVLISIAVSINLISWNFDTALMAMRYIKVQPLISIVAALVNVFIAYFFITNYGITGAAFSLIFLNLFQMILRAVAIKYKINQIGRRDNV